MIGMDELVEGQHLDMNVGDSYSLFYGNSEEYWWDEKYEWSSSNPTVAMVYYSQLFAMQGGETTVTLRGEGEEISFTISVPETPHGDIYFTCRGEDHGHSEEMGDYIVSYTDRLIVNGIMTDELCNILASDGQGNLWKGYYSDEAVSLSVNGKPIVDSHEFPVTYFGRHNFRARKDKLYLIPGVNMGNEFRYAAISTDGTWKETTVGNQDLEETWGQTIGVADIDEGPDGNIVLWGYASSFRLYMWNMSPEGTLSGHVPWYNQDDRYLFGSAALDSEGNDYELMYFSELIYICKNGKPIWKLSGVERPKLIVHDNDFYVACLSPEEDGRWDSDLELYLIKNGDPVLLDSHLPCGSDLDFCISRTGVPYIITGAAGGFSVYKEGTRILFFPYINCYEPMLAVVD